MKLWSADELAHHRFVIPFLVEPIIPRGGIVFFHGKRNIGKSQLALTLAACLAEGGALFGRYPTHLHGSVVYVQTDMTAPVEQLRVKQIHDLYPLDKVFFCFPNYFDIAAMGDTDKVIQDIRALNPSFIVWDTLRKIHRGDMSKDDSLPSLIYGRSKELFPGATHLYVHHDKKTVIDQDQLDQEELFRGTGAWLDDCDTGLHLSSVGGNKLALTFTKVRTAPPQRSILLTMNQDTLLLYAAESSVMTQLADLWRYRNPQGTTPQLERYLLSSFVGTPRVIHHLLHGDPAQL